MSAHLIMSTYFNMNCITLNWFFSQKLSVDSLYDDAFILAVQAKMLEIDSVKILRVNQETLDLSLIHI